MNRRAIFLVSLASAGAITMAACSGDDSTTEDGGNDSSTIDVAQDVAKKDASTTDAANDVVTVDASDAGDGGCLASWLDVPDAGSALVPEGGLPTLNLHASATGTQDYTCTGTATDAGTTTYAWLFVGPEANLDDCHDVLMGHHFASEAGAAAPEWQTLDTSFVIAKKIVPYDAGSASIPWLLLQETSNGGSGEIAKTLWVQRLFTTGGNPPTATCDSGSVGTTQKVAYTADYYFYGN
jgi:hypothetical protein